MLLVILLPPLLSYNQQTHNSDCPVTSSHHLSDYEYSADAANTRNLDVLLGKILRNLEHRHAVGLASKLNIE